MESQSIESIANKISNGQASRIVVLSGAGISTAAGVPDFRSPLTGLYDKLQRLKLPYPEALFSIQYFRHSPELFYALAGARHPRHLKPTVSHSFLALLAKKGLLHKHFTQNVDCLDRAAGVPQDKTFLVHGSWASQHCSRCQKPYPDEEMSKAVESGSVPRCQSDDCDAPVKPDIVFYGESIHKDFTVEEQKVKEADLLIVIGTSLKVYPFAGLAELAEEGVPRVLINAVKAGQIGSRPDDVFFLGDCDEQVRKLADALGWRDELEALWKEVAPSAEDARETQKTMSEEVDKAIDKIVAQMDPTIHISKGHKDMLENHLASKFASLMPKDAKNGASSKQQNEIAV